MANTMSVQMFMDIIDQLEKRKEDLTEDMAAERVCIQDFEKKGDLEMQEYCSRKYGQFSEEFDTVIRLLSGMRKFSVIIADDEEDEEE